MKSRIYDTSVALSAYHGAAFLHLGRNVDFTYSSRMVLSSVLLGDVTQCTR